MLDVGRWISARELTTLVVYSAAAQRAVQQRLESERDAAGPVRSEFTGETRARGAQCAEIQSRAPLRTSGPAQRRKREDAAMRTRTPQVDLESDVNFTRESCAGAARGETRLGVVGLVSTLVEI